MTSSPHCLSVSSGGRSTCGHLVTRRSCHNNVLERQVHTAYSYASSMPIRKSCQHQSRHGTQWPPVHRAGLMQPDPKGRLAAARNMAGIRAVAIGPSVDLPQSTSYCTKYHEYSSVAFVHSASSFGLDREAWLRGCGSVLNTRPTTSIGLGALYSLHRCGVSSRLGRRDAIVICRGWQSRRHQWSRPGCVGYRHSRYRAEFAVGSQCLVGINHRPDAS